MSESVEIPAGRLSFAEFVAWSQAQPQGRYELLDGQVLAMAPERGIHLRTKLAAVNALARAIEVAGLPCEALPDGATVRTAAETAFEPDATVTCGEAMGDDDVVAPNPVIVVEVLSPGTRRIDTGRKLAEYFRLPSVQHYLLLVTDQRCVVHHARGTDGGLAPRLIDAGEIRLDPPGLVLRAEELFAPKRG